MADRIELTVKFLKKGSYTSYYGFVENEILVFTFEDVNIKKLYVWKTSGSGFNANYNSILRIKGTIKCETEYKGIKQIEIQRVKLLEVVERAKTKQELAEEKEKEQEEKEKEQLASLKDGDTILTMTYKNFKEHYSDCETLANSFFRNSKKQASIKVIVRNGRLKNSGVRNKHFYGYRLLNKKTKTTSCFRAVCAENAYKQAVKAFPETNIEQWEVVNIY